MKFMDKYIGCCSLVLTTAEWSQPYLIKVMTISVTINYFQNFPYIKTPISVFETA